MSANYLQNECAHTECEVLETTVGLIMVKDAHVGTTRRLKAKKQGDMQLKRAIQHATKTLEKMQQH
jgi:hypothetical protein